jgi:hypothetical protein
VTGVATGVGAGAAAGVGTGAATGVGAGATATAGFGATALEAVEPLALGVGAGFVVLAVVEVVEVVEVEVAGVAAGRLTAAVGTGVTEVDGTAEPAAASATVPWAIADPARTRRASAARGPASRTKCSSRTPSLFLAESSPVPT